MADVPPEDAAAKAAKEEKLAAAKKRVSSFFLQISQYISFQSLAVGFRFLLLGVKASVDKA